MLLIGYGNPGRGDDGLGPAFVDRIEARALPDVECRVAYQLMVDHAQWVSETDMVVFVDAQISGDRPFQINEVAGGEAPSLTSHSLTPSNVLGLTEALYAKVPSAYTLGISGREFSKVKEGLSFEARQHLDLAEQYFLDWLQAKTNRAHGMQSSAVESGQR